MNRAAYEERLVGGHPCAIGLDNNSSGSLSVEFEAAFRRRLHSQGGSSCK
jgi:hypothetical protein